MIERRSGRWGSVRALGALAMLATVLALAAGCSHGDDPVGGLTVEPAHVTLAYPQPIPVRLTWTPTVLPESDSGTLVVFVHLLSGPKQVIRTFDHPFPKTWTPGTPVTYSIDLGQSALAPPIVPGHYILSIGLYDGAHQRFALRTTGQELAHQEYQVAEVEVLPTAAPAPTFAFSSGWDAPEPTGDNQKPMRRWVDDPGTITISGMPANGIVRLSLRVPEVKTDGGEKLLLDPGVERPRVAVTSTCGAGQLPVDGYGPHVLDVRVAAGQSCDITVDPLFKVVRSDTVTPRAPAFLEDLEWKPEAPATPAKPAGTP